jgi:hypothetical protein
MDPKKYLKLLAKELASEFAPIPRLKKFTRNPIIIGAHAEAAVRQFVRRAVAPLRVSTGAIIYEDNTGEGATLRQIDTMIWSTAMAPAVFECGEFALVPRGNCHVALEIKRSMYPCSGKSARDILAEEKNLFTDWVQVKGNVVSPHKTPEGNAPNMLAVFCIEGDKPDAEAKKLVEEGKALLLLKSNGGTNHEDLLKFVNVLLQARWLSMQTQSFHMVNAQLVRPAKRTARQRKD